MSNKTKTDGPKMKLVTDLYGDKNASVFEQNLEESNVKRFYFDGFRTNEEDPTILDLIFTVELEHYGIVRLTQKIGFFSEEQKIYLENNCSLGRFNKDDDIVFSDFSHLNFEPCVDFIQEENTKSLYESKYYLYAGSVVLIKDKESIVLVKMVFDFNQFLYMQYITSRFLLHFSYSTAMAINVCELVLEEQNVYEKGEICSIYIPSMEQIWDMEEELNEKEEILRLNSLVSVKFTNGRYSQKIGIGISDFSPYELSKYIYSSSYTTTDQNVLFEDIDSYGNGIVTIEEIPFGFYTNTSRDTYKAYIAIIGAHYNKDEEKFDGNNQLVVIPFKTKAKINDYMINFRVRKTDRKF